MYFLVGLLAAVVLGPAHAERRTTLVPAGAPFYTPDTGLGLGLYVIACVDAASPSEEGEIALFCTATEKRQVSAGIAPEISRPWGRLSGYFEANRYPGTFWGIGPDTDESRKETYEPGEISARASVLFRVADGLYAGPRAAVLLGDIVPGGPELETVRGGRGTRSLGFGFAVNLDTRNDRFYPRTGTLAGLTAEVYPRGLGNGADYARMEADLRRYVDLGFGVLAVQGLISAAEGGVPFRALSSLGGSMIMRGFPSGRFLDTTSAAVQGELRFPLPGRFGAAAFLAAGEAQPSFADYNPGDLRVAGGGGLRFFLDQERNITARLDVGFTSEGTAGVYLLVKEAF